MKHAIEMDSDGMIYIPSFVKIVAVIQKVIGRIHRNTDSVVIA
jgi:hypothetical protein